jgi:hypothetical protein
MRRESTPPGKNRTILCPQLGHLVPFSYCRSENRGLPCTQILHCWYDHFLVEDYLRKALSEEEWENFLRKPFKPKLVSLLESMEAAGKAKDEACQRSVAPRRREPCQQKKNVLGKRFF